MRKARRQRLAVVTFVVVGASVTLALALVALQGNIDLFYEPARVVGGDAPQGVDIRAGGMVVEGSLDRDAEGLGVSFAITDYQGHDFEVRYVGLLPDLFQEGKGILVRGRLDGHGVFDAHEVLAKHDENYLPPELHGLAQHPEVQDPANAADAPRLPVLATGAGGLNSEIRPPPAGVP